MKKILSIIVPSYNMEQYLDKCLSSMIVDDEELLQSLDVIIVNDGSKDGTSEIAHAYEAKHPDVFRVIDKNNGHFGSCINAAIAVVRGKYVRVVDADDSVCTEEFARFLLWLSEHNDLNADVVITNFSKVNLEGAILRTISFEEIGSDPISPLALNSLSISYVGSPALTYKTDLLRDMKYRQLEGYPYTDTHWALLPFALVRKIMFAPFCVVRYLIGREGQTMQPEELIANVDKHAIVSLDLYQKYKELSKKILGDSMPYMDKVIYDNVRWMIMLYSVGYDGIVPRSTGECFDKQLRALLPNVYEQTNSLYIGGKWRFYYAREWRKSYARTSWRFRLFRLKSKIGRFANSLFR